MQIYLLSPVVSNLFPREVIDGLKSMAEVITDSTCRPLEQIIANSPAEKIIALDPDYCNWSLDAATLAKLENVLAICLQSTSFSWIDLKAASQKNIAIINIRNYSTQSVAEWAVMMALCVARKIPLIAKNNWKGDFTLHQGMELKGKTAGIIGLGNIGKRIAKICQGMGMKVVYWSQNSQDNRFTKVELPQLFPAQT